MWAEPDPYLISFWAALCEPCILERERVFEALRKIRERGWARPGPPIGDDELPRTPRPQRLRRVGLPGDFSPAAGPRLGMVWGCALG